MSDALGFRRKFGVIAPSTNTIVQPELDAIRPRGVTNHVSRIAIRDRLVKNDDDFLKLIADIRGGTIDAVDVAMSCAPDALILAASAESFWDGVEGGRRLQERIEERAAVGVAIPSEASSAALRKFGSVKRLGVITPYMAVGDQQVRKFFIESGYEIIALKGLRCQSPLRVAQVGEAELRDAIDELDDPLIEAIVLVGSNLAAARIAAIAERWLDMPVIAANTATYWRALRRNGIEDKVYGFGSLLEDY
jgi:maleate isomerase